MRLPRFSEGVIRRPATRVAGIRGRIEPLRNELTACGDQCTGPNDKSCRAICPCTLIQATGHYICTQ